MTYTLLKKNVDPTRLKLSCIHLLIILLEMNVSIKDINYHVIKTL
jgi:hypothetical protein